MIAVRRQNSYENVFSWGNFGFSLFLPIGICPWELYSKHPLEITSRKRVNSRSTTGDWKDPSTCFCNISECLNRWVRIVVEYDRRKDDMDFYVNTGETPNPSSWSHHARCYFWHLRVSSPSRFVAKRIYNFLMGLKIREWKQTSHWL